MRNLDGLLCVGIAIVSAAALMAQTPSPQSTSPASPPRAAEPSTEATGQAVTVVGCLYRASDDVNVFAVKRTEGAGAGAVGTAGTTASATSSSDTAGTAAGSTGAAAATRPAWYRLATSGTQDFNSFVGRAVRVTGTVPSANGGAPSTSAPTVQISSAKFTTAELGSASQIVVQSITAAEGECPAPAATQNQPQQDQRSQPQR
ncbi:MAG TPA: hypothetical protein VJP86_01730 [Vicinamibacterales bacterium]|jgi:hypothetical protein|nr:hypothetical protein [Vicinamibacterales bacterium]